MKLYSGNGNWGIPAIAVGILLVFPSLALANMLTPLMWMEAFRLMPINAGLGILEGILIALIFKCRTRTCIVIMILANYFSWIIGEVFIVSSIGKRGLTFLGEVPLYRAPQFLAAITICAYIVTLVAEWPFCLWAVWKAKRRWIKSVAACFIVQSISYTLLIFLYLQSSQISVYTELSVEKDLSFAKTKDAWVYFIGRDDAGLWRIRVDGREREKIMEGVVSKDKLDDYFGPMLYVWRSQEGGQWDLWIGQLRGSEQNRLVVKDFSEHAQPAMDLLNPQEERREEWLKRAGVDAFSSYFDLQMATDLREASQETWAVETGPWFPTEGLRAENRATGEKLHVAVEAPFLRWASRNATILPGDQVVYELGGQIVLLDLNERKIGFITRGLGPVVVLGSEVEGDGLGQPNEP